MACYNPRTPSLPLPDPHPPPDNVSSSPALYADGCSQMAEINIHKTYEHVTVQSVGVRVVTFLQNHYCVLHLAMHEVDPEVSACRQPPLAVPCWATYGTDHSREGDHI